MDSPSSPDAPIAVIGLGYVGLPLAVVLARRFAVVGFDVDAGRVAELTRGFDRTGEIDAATLGATALHVSSDPAALAAVDTFIVTVPTPVDAANRPDLGAVLGACDTVGAVLRPGATVVFESTGLSGRHRGHLRAAPGSAFGPALRGRFLPRLFAGAHQPRRPHPHGRQDRQGRGGPDARGGPAAGGALRRDQRRQRVRRQGHPHRRGGQGDRERPARHQHRLRQRGDPGVPRRRAVDPRRAGGGAHQVELPRFPARFRRRALHRRRPLLSGPLGGGTRPRPADHPGRAAAQRRHGPPSSPIGSRAIWAVRDRSWCSA